MIFSHTAGFLFSYEPIGQPGPSRVG